MRRPSRSTPQCSRRIGPQPCRREFRRDARKEVRAAMEDLGRAREAVRIPDRDGIIILPGPLPLHLSGIACRAARRIIAPSTASETPLASLSARRREWYARLHIAIPWTGRITGS